MLNLGIFPLILYGADVLFTRYHREFSNLSTREDVHQFVEIALALLNPMTDGNHRLRHLSIGWWTLVSWKGVDYEAFLVQLLFVFSTHDVLISEKRIRDSFADLIRTAHSVYRKLKCKRFWREIDLSKLDDQVLRMKSSMVKLFNLPIDNTVETFNLAAMCRIPGISCLSRDMHHSHFTNDLLLLILSKGSRTTATSSSSTAASYKHVASASSSSSSSLSSAGTRGKNDSRPSSSEPAHTQAHDSDKDKSDDEETKQCQRFRNFLGRRPWYLGLGREE
jgi:hypothetical protein